MSSTLQSNVNKLCLVWTANAEGRCYIFVQLFLVFVRHIAFANIDVNHLVIANISDWMYKNKLKLNQEKTEFIVFASNTNEKHIVANNMFLNDANIPRSNTVRNLGVYMDTQLNMMYHINNVKKRCFYYIGW